MIMEKLNRRSFLRSSALAGLGAASLPHLLPARLCASDSKPSSPLTMGFIGMGKQSRGLLGAFLGQNTRVLAVCDVDTTRREAARQRVDEFYTLRAGAGSKGGDCAAYNDFQEIIQRKDIDAVCIATPDHWHAVITLAALRAGKDVYCEKPLTHNIHEAIEVMRGAAREKRILQTGSMQRSSSEFRVACELVRNGMIGKVREVGCSFSGPPMPCNLPEEPSEPGLDWDMWLGPAPVRPYNSALSPRGEHNHFPAWRDYSEFGGGGVADWGAHHLDIAQWGLGMDASGPVRATPPANPGGKKGACLIYANGVIVKHEGGFGVDFSGSEGRVRVNRGKFIFEQQGKVIAAYDGKDRETNLARQLQIAREQFLGDAKIKLYASGNHVSDFLKCVETRQQPITNAEVGGRSAICCHLLNLVYLHGREIKWDPEKLALAGGTGDPEWLTRPYRGAWKV